MSSAIDNTGLGSRLYSKRKSDMKIKDDSVYDECLNEGGGGKRKQKKLSVS